MNIIKHPAPPPQKKKTLTWVHNTNDDIEIAFRAQNTIQNLAKQHPRTDITKVASTKWIAQTAKCVGQMRRAFGTRCYEHIQTFKNNNSKSGYSTIQDIGHRYGTITGSMDIIGTHRREKHLNSLKQGHIYKNSKVIRQMIDKNTDTNNQQNTTRTASQVSTKATSQKHRPRITVMTGCRAECCRSNKNKNI